MAGRRSDFLNRISSVGWGARESVQTLLATMVAEVRTRVADDAVPDAELDRVIAFHDTVETLWRDTLASDPPLAVTELRARLDGLVGACTGSLQDMIVHLRVAREHARALDITKKIRTEDDAGGGEGGVTTP